jgi:DNA-binding NtrC family response regulator
MNTRNGTEDDDSVTIRGVPMTDGGEALSVLVLCPDFIATYPLPELGEVTIGRSHAVEIYVDDPLVSRRHAIVSATPKVAIRDLGSSNGTRVGGVPLSPGETRELAVGDVVMLGSAALLVQRGTARARSRRFWDREHFEERLREECARSEGADHPFAVACLHVGRDAPQLRVRQLLADALRTSDVVGEYGRVVYAILIVEAVRARGDALCHQITRALAAQDITARWDVAYFPRDGRTAEELLARAQVATLEPGTRGHERRLAADPATQELLGVAERIAAGDINVLITGETGVGKEVMSEEIHRRSARAAGPFLRLNCAALSESLLESELFGHERGAFTSAVAVKPGLLESANGGTVLLDEIGELPMTMQVKLLRVIEEKRVRRVGAVKAHPLDVRFLAATNRDLEEHASRGLFRWDLYYRLAGATLKIPPLRERPGDIEPLVRAFLAEAVRHVGGRIPEISPEAMAQLIAYRWPGNIRELRHVIERAVLLAGGAPVTPAHLPFEATSSAQPARPGAATAAPATAAPAGTGAEPAPDDEAQAILDVLAACGGNQSRAAKQLGMSRGALIRRLVRYGITRPRKSN